MDINVDLLSEAFQQIKIDIQTVYLEYQLPWVIGYSGGKDSTALLQLIWYALEELPEEQLVSPIHVLSSDTLVETPVIVDHIVSNIKKIRENATKRLLPIEAHIVKPKIGETFWVNLIGKGYAAPGSRFRWCTDRLKIRPANHFIETKLKEFGNVIVVLGARKDESVTRKQSEFRNYLGMTQKKEHKATYRNPKRRNGQIMEKKIKDKHGVRQRTGEVVLGPYWMWFRKELLTKLLKIETEIQTQIGKEDFRLITHDELLEIRRLWRMEDVEDPDWNDTVPRIYREVKGKELNYQKDFGYEFSLIDQELLEEICREEGVPLQLIKKLLVAEQKAQGVSRRATLFKNLRAVFNEEWRTEKDVLKSFQQQ
jgi:3'-phosphoadenosine 5'-phosphosulfate sulfotransferase (PAPS reductase)/FAD synthetase